MTDTEILGREIPGREPTNEEKVLAAINGRPDGCSSIAIAIETRIQRGAVEFILEKLQARGKVQSTRNGKGVLTWYPGVKPECEGPEPAPPIVGPRATPEVKPDPLPLVKPPKESESTSCKFCGKVLTSPGRKRQHEVVCGSNPKRNVGGAKRDRWAPKAMVTCELCGEIYTKIAASTAYRILERLRDDGTVYRYPVKLQSPLARKKRHVVHVLTEDGKMLAEAIRARAGGYA